MKKRTFWALMVLGGIATSFWLSRNFKLVRTEPATAGQVQESDPSARKAGDFSAERIRGEEVPESPRHAAGEMERHRSAALDLAPLNRAIRDQEDKVEERRKVLSTIIRTKGIIYRGQDSFDSQFRVEGDQELENAVQVYNDLQSERVKLESQINSLMKYDDEQLIIYTAGLDLPDNAVKLIYPQYLEAKRELDVLKRQGQGDRHPTLIAQSEKVETIVNQLNEGVVNLRTTLQAQLEMARQRLKESRQQAINQSIDAQDYVDAKRDFETDQQLLQEMKLKQISEKIKRESEK